MNDLNLILCLIHLYFPAAYHADWRLAKASSSCNQMDTTTFSFTYLPFSLSQEDTVFLFSRVSSQLLGDSPELSPLLSARTTHWVTVSAVGLQSHVGWALSGVFLLKSLFRRFTALKAVAYPIFLEVSKGQMLLVPCLSSSQTPLLTAPPPARLACWSLSSFTPDLSSPLPLSISLRVISSIPTTFSFYMLTISKVISSAQSSLLNHRPA